LREVTDRFGRSGPLRQVADFGPHRLGVLVRSPDPVADIRRNSAVRQIGFHILDYLYFGLGEIRDQLAGYVRPGVARISGPDQAASRFRFFAQDYGDSALN
jgi:hypothetical protein